MLPYRGFGHYYAVPSTRMSICNICNFLLLEFCILCVLVCLWLLVVYLIEVTGCLSVMLCCASFMLSRGADKSLAFPISYFPICSTTKRIFLG
jgi:hypothetical protein